MLCVYGDLHSPEDAMESPRIFHGLPLREFSTPSRGYHGKSQILPLTSSSQDIHMHWPEDLMGNSMAFLKILFHGDLCIAQRM